MASGEDLAFSPSTRMVRKLAAILIADVKGYSRLMGEDDAATVQTLAVHKALIDTFVQRYQGRVVNSPGANLLAEIASVVDAEAAAVPDLGERGARSRELSVDRGLDIRS